MIISGGWISTDPFESIKKKITAAASYYSGRVCSCKQKSEKLAAASSSCITVWTALCSPHACLAALHLLRVLAVALFAHHIAPLLVKRAAARCFAL